jgi:hypothetical protein
MYIYAGKSYELKHGLQYVWLERCNCKNVAKRRCLAQQRSYAVFTNKLRKKCRMHS